MWGNLSKVESLVNNNNQSILVHWLWKIHDPKILTVEETGYGVYGKSLYYLCNNVSILLKLF